MNVDKSLLQEYFIQKDYDKFFSEAKKITDFILTKNFKIYDVFKRDEMSQECLENLWKKVIQGKIDPSKNLMAFIWTNSTRRIQEIFRKEFNRQKIATFTSYDINVYTYEGFNYSGYRYIEPELAELMIPTNI